MIIVKLMGGLGNQMFQYAAARRLSLKHGCALKLDLSCLSASSAVATPRSYELDHFCISAEIASPLDVSVFVGHSEQFLKNGLKYLLFKRDLAKPSGKVFQERHFQFNSALLDAPDNVYLDGYWQSEKYFMDTAEAIRKDFDFTQFSDEQNIRLADIISKVQAVSIHVRRGDYVSNPAASAFHCTCPAAFFYAAMELVVQQVDNPHFFIFSDDIHWCRKNINSSYPITFLDHNGDDRAYEDLRLMSMCRHHITANSSFSWWGAWLNPRPDKIVIAPMRWFNDPTIDTSDLMPASWQRIMI